MSIKTLADLRTAVNNDIKTNGVRAITGAIMNTQLIDVIDSLEGDYVAKDGLLDTRIQSLENMTFVVLQDPATGWDASTGTFPGGGTAKAGYKWEVTTPGVVDGVEFDDGDFILAVTDNASSTTYAANWVKEDSADRVRSVRGESGDVTGVAKVEVAAGNPTVNSDDVAGFLAGDIWVNSSTGFVYIADNVATGAASWRDINRVNEAPIDGTQYARKNEAWEAVSAGTAFSDVIYVDSESGDNGTGEVGNASKPFLTPEYVVSNVVNTGTITGNTATNTTISNISDAHNANLKVGQWLSGSGFNYGTIIVAKGNEGGNANTITLNKATTATATGVTISWHINYFVKCTGAFVLVGYAAGGNLSKSGFNFDFGDSTVIINNTTPFFESAARHTPFFVSGGYWEGRTGLSAFILNSGVASNHTFIIDIKRFYTNVNSYAFNFTQNGVQKYSIGKITCGHL